MPDSPVSAKTLLLYQHKPVIAPVVIEAVSSLDCEVKVASNQEQFFNQYNESLVNPFRIFGGAPIQGIILDLVHATQKSLDVLFEMHQRFTNLPPVIGFCRPQMAKKTTFFLKNGIEELAIFPGKNQNLQNQLRSFIQKNNKRSGESKPVSISEHPDHLPVINLKTYGMFKELASLQDFTLDQLFQSFLEEMQGFLYHLIREFERENDPACERFVVSIRSLGSTLGASQMAQTARHMEFFFKTGRSTEAGLLLPNLIQQFMTLRDYLQKDPIVLEEPALLY